jgi:hypothetical protein
MQWYYLLQGQRQGPVDDADLEALVRQGIVQDETLVWREGLTEWHAYGAVRPRPTPVPPSKPEPPRPEPAPSKAVPFIQSPGTGGPKPETATPPPQAAEPKREPGWPEALPFPADPAPHASPAGAAPKPGPRGGSHGFFFFYAVLDALSDGGVIRKGVVVCLKVGAVLCALAGLLGALTVLTNALHGTGGMALGGVLFAVLILLTAACVGQICWHRAKAVAALQSGTSYTVIPIFAILSRASGEAAATALVGIGAGACFFFWLSPEGAAASLQGVPFLAQLPAESGFLSGIILLVYLATLGFAALILGYLWAECMMLLVNIEQNTRRNI